jgi:nitrite reductase (NO-forming)
MTKQTLTDIEVADVLTYVYNSWGNNKTNVKVSDVMEARSSH